MPKDVAMRTLALALAAIGVAACMAMLAGCHRAAPPVQTHVVKIAVALPSASAEVVEAEISLPLQRSLQSLPGNQAVTTISAYGRAEIYVEVRTSDKPDAAIAAVKQNVDAVKHRLPQEATVAAVSLLPSGSPVPNPVITIEPTLNVVIDRDRAAQFCIPFDEVQKAIAQATSRASTQPSGWLFEGEYLRAVDGRLVPLSRLTTVTRTATPSHIVNHYR